MKFLGILLLTVALFQKASAQIKMFGGGNYCAVRNDELKNEKPILAWHLGTGVTVYPVKAWEKFSVDTNLMVSQKGYKQYADEWYSFTFSYFSFQLIANYEAKDFLSFQAGVDLSNLTNTSMKQGMETYNHFDGGIIAGISFLDNKPQGFYFRLIYGLTPMLEYEAVDSMGNFKSVKDLKNICLTAGIRYNVYDKKFSF